MLQQYAILQCLMPTFDLTLRLRVVRCAANVAHAVVVEPNSEVAGDVARSVVRKQPWLVGNIGLVTARCLKSKLRGLGNIAAGHASTQLPGNHIA